MPVAVLLLTSVAVYVTTTTPAKAGGRSKANLVADDRDGVRGVRQ